MDTQNFSEDVLFINLPEYPQHGDEIDTINKMLSNSVDRDVVIDFSKVKMLTSENICGLMILDKLLKGSGHQLVLCYVSSYGPVLWRFSILPPMSMKPYGLFKAGICHWPSFNRYPKAGLVAEGPCCFA